MKKQRRGTQVTPHCFRKNGFGDYEEVWDLENPSLPPLHDDMTAETRRVLPTSGSCGSGKPSNPSHQHAPLGTIHCGFAKNLPDFRSPNTIVFYIRLFKERSRIFDIARTKLIIFPDMTTACPKVLFLRPDFVCWASRIECWGLKFFQGAALFLHFYSNFTDKLT